jgi:hypothetical protein
MAVTINIAESIGAKVSGLKMGGNNKLAGTAKRAINLDWVDQYHQDHNTQKDHAPILKKLIVILLVVVNIP